MRSHVLLVTVAVLLPLALPGLARGQVGASADGSCASDDDCPQGLVCEVVGGMGCAVPACAPDSTDCPEPQPCESQDIYGCVPGPCESDADCGDGMVCLTSTYAAACPDTSGGAVLPPCEGPDCPAASDPDCTEENVEVQACVPAWMAPCTTDSDCGPEGFTCEEVSTCICNGSASTGAETPPASGSDPQGDCICEPTGEKSCQLVEQSCTSDSDCPDGWNCTNAPEEPATCVVTAEGDTQCDTPADSATGLCTPPYWSSAGGYGPEAPGDQAGEPRADSGSDLATAPPEEQPSGCAATGSVSTLAAALALLPLLLRRRR